MVILSMILTILSFTFVTDLVEAAFFLCSYEFAIKSENSPWCNLLDEVDADP